jgi:hypothetical protein
LDAALAQVEVHRHADDVGIFVDEDASANDGLAYAEERA